MIESILNNSIIYLKNNWVNLVLDTFLAIWIFIIGYILIQRVVNKIKKRIEENSLEEDVYIKKNSTLVGKLVFVLLMIFLILAVFQVIGFDTAIIMWWISLSLWFTMETTIRNMIAGIIILTNKKVKLGDFVELLGKLKILWTIDEINIRYTVIKTYERKRIIIPNSILANTPIKTYKSEPLVRGEIFFTVPRHVHIPQVKKILIESINTNTKILYKEYTNVRIENFNAKWIKIKGVFFTDPKEKTSFIMARELRPVIAENLKKYGINIPYPHITLSTEVWCNSSV